MNNWERTLISPTTPIIQVLKVIDYAALQIALVVDNHNRLLGTVTDGDVRRGILKGIRLDDEVTHIMNPHPVIGRIDDSRETILNLMKRNQLRHVPIVDESGKVIYLETMETIVQGDQHENWVVIMAGGLGNRLRPLTDHCPKPLLKVGGKPLLETIIESIVSNGFTNIYLSVNYKAQMVEDYFGDGSRWNADIKYIRENNRMGTAGALTLLKNRPQHPMIVMNGDLLTKVNFKQLIHFHKDSRVAATMCVRNYELQIPYGVIETDKNRIIKIEEKPIRQFFVNAGIYVLNPDVIDFIPHNSFYDMPDLFKTLIDNSYETAAFPILEYWLDIGQIDDYHRANGDFAEVFG